MRKLLVGSISLLFLVACTAASPMATTPTAGPDSDALSLVAMARDAEGRVSQMITNPVLRVVVIDLSPSGGLGYYFTDSEATQGLTVLASSDMPPEQWQLVQGDPRLLGYPRPGMDLEGLVIGPGSAERLAVEHWQRGDLRGLSLAGERQDLYWLVFWNLPDGVASGTVDARTGTFTPSSAPPAKPPHTAIATPST